jgi:hypothetical protein
MILFIDFDSIYYANIFGLQLCFGERQDREAGAMGILLPAGGALRRPGRCLSATSGNEEKEDKFLRSARTNKN